MQEDHLKAHIAHIYQYEGIQFDANFPWQDFEGYLFQSIVNWFGNWMRGKAQNIKNSNVINNIKLEVKDIEKTIPENSSVDKQNGRYPNGKLNSELILDSVLEYTISSLDDFVSTIYSIGNISNNQSLTNTQPYVIKFKNNTKIFLSINDHYAFPLRKPDGSPYNLEKYKHDYDSLIPYAVKKYSSNYLSLSAVAGFLKGDLDLIQTYKNDEAYEISILTLLSANYICESNRNWMQFFLALLQLGRQKKPSFLAQQVNEFPMATGGSWSGKWSWGNERNPKAEASAAPNDGNQIKRWCLAVLFRILYPIPTGLNDTKKNEAIRKIAEGLLPWFRGTEKRIRVLEPPPTKTNFPLRKALDSAYQNIKSY